jgi:hypothetical protein
LVQNSLISIINMQHIIKKKEKLISKVHRVAVFKLINFWLLFNANSAISWWEQIHFEWDDDEVCFLLDQHA